MKKAYILSAFIWCLLALAACSKEANDTNDTKEPEGAPLIMKSRWRTNS